LGSVIGYMQSCEEIDVEKEFSRIAKQRGYGQIPKHADYAIICRDYAVVVEDTDSPKGEDIEKLENTITWLLSEKLGNTQIVSQNFKVFAVIHFHRHSDAAVHKVLLSRTGRMQMQGKRVLFHAFRCGDKHDVLQRLALEAGMRLG